MITKKGVKKANLNSRIEQIRSKIYGGSNKMFAAQIGEIEQTLSQICLGKRNVGHTTLNRIITGVDGLNVEWLMTGKGDMMKDGAKQQVVIDIPIAKAQPAKPQPAQPAQPVLIQSPQQAAEQAAQIRLLTAQLKDRDNTIAELISKVAVLQYQLDEQKKLTFSETTTENITL